MARYPGETQSVRNNLSLVVAESISEGYAPFSHTMGLSASLKKMGYNTHIIAEDNGPYHKTHLFNRIARFYRINRAAIRALSHSDLMLARGHFAHLPWTLVARFRGIPVVHEMNGHVHDARTTHRWLSPFQSIITKSYKLQLQSASGITCITQEIAESINAMGFKAPSVVIGNGVDHDIFYPLHAEEKKSPDTSPISEGHFAVYPSAMTAWHGIATLLEAAQHPSWPKTLNVVIVGDGAHSEKVREAAALHKNIRYAGLLSQKDLSALLRQASLGLCLVEPKEERGLQEVYPLKLFELMASGLAIVATDIPGQRDIVSNCGAGRLVPPRDPAALAMAVAAVFGDRDRHKMGNAGAQAVKAHYSWDHRAEEYNAFIKTILTDTKKA